MIEFLTVVNALLLGVVSGVEVDRLDVVSTKQGGIRNIPLVIPVVSGTDSNSHAGAIAGAVIGGFVMLLLIAIGMSCLHRVKVSGAYLNIT